MVWFQPFFFFLVASSDDHNNRHNIVPVTLSCNHFYSKKRCQKKQESWRHLQKNYQKHENSLKIYAKHVFDISTAVHNVWNSPKKSQHSCYWIGIFATFLVISLVCNGNNTFWPFLFFLNETFKSKGFSNIVHYNYNRCSIEKCIGLKNIWAHSLQ